MFGNKDKKQNKTEKEVNVMSNKNAPEGTEPNPAPLKPSAKKFARKKAVSLPQLKIEDDKPYFVKIDSKIKLEKSKEPGKEEEKETQVVNVVYYADDGSTEVQRTMICGTVLVERLNEVYPNDSYVGKTFEIIRTKVQGKRWKNFEIYEVEN